MPELIVYIFQWVMVLCGFEWSKLVHDFTIRVSVPHILQVFLRGNPSKVERIFDFRAEFCRHKEIEKASPFNAVH